jgi:hypothetical protein
MYYVEYFTRRDGVLVSSGGIKSVRGNNIEEAHLGAVQKATTVDFGYRLYEGPMMSLIRPVTGVVER